MKLISNVYHVELVLVTPALAAVILKMNTRNRPINARRVESLKRDLILGRWMNTGSGITISRSGVLLDGQHRLEAIVQSGISIEIPVATGVDDKAQMTIDSGQPRKFAQQIGIQFGAKNASRTASAIRAIAGFIEHSNRVHRSNTDLQEYYDLYTDDISHVIKTIGTKVRGELVGALALARNIHGFKGAVDEFSRRYAECDFSGKTDPVRALYQRVTSTDSAGGHDELFERTLNALVSFNTRTPMERIGVNKNVNDTFRSRAKRPSSVTTDES